MAGRPITVNTRAAQLKRERMRGYRQRDKERQSAFNAKPLAQVITQWRTQ